MFALVDCNQFFVSCERAFQPKLWGRPVIVLSNNDGCVIARSQEAKQLGIAMGAPFFKVKTLCETEGVTVFSSNFQLYADLSARIMMLLREWVSDVEVYSIDEAFLDLTGVSDPEAFAFLIRERILQWVGIPVSIGIASTKTLAKVATQFAKDHDHYGGVFSFTDPAVEEAVLDRLSLRDVWGIGPRTAEKLQASFGISTALMLRRSDPHRVRKVMNVMVQRIVYELQGISCLRLEDMPTPKKSMVYSRSFGEKIRDLRSLEEAVSLYASRLALKLRESKQIMQGLVVFVRSSPFVTSHAFYRASAFQACDPPTSDTQVIIRQALLALRGCFKQGVLYHKAGVMAVGLQPESDQPLVLFSSGSDKKSQALSRIVDSINGVHGQDRVRYAVTGLERGWMVKSESLSSRYTTDWGELLVVG